MLWYTFKSRFLHDYHINSWRNEMTLFFRFLLILVFDTFNPWIIAFRALFIFGAWLLFSKAGLDPKWALVPWAREYHLGLCAGKEAEGRAFSIISVIITGLSAAALFVSEDRGLDDPILIALAPLIVVLLASVLLMRFIYNIRIFSGIIRQYGLRKRWWLLPCLFDGFRIIPMLIWGLNSRYQPLQKQVKAVDEKERMTASGLKMRTQGRLGQIGNHIVRFLYMFVKKRDWMTLPMAAILSGLVGMAVKDGFRSTMELTLTGAYAMTIVCIWEGCYNSIHVVCRERDMIRREHPQGMHISSYIAAHMLYQLLLCLVQTAVILVVTAQVGMDYSGPGLFTPWFIADFGITVFLVTYAADMMALCISSLVHTPITALMILPFVLIFQLIFSEGLIPFPPMVKPFTVLSISSPSLSAMRTQADINEREFSTVTTVLDMMDETPIDEKITLGQILDILTDETNPSIAAFRKMKVGRVMTLGDAMDNLINDPRFEIIRRQQIFSVLTVGDVLKLINETGILKNYRDVEFGVDLTVGDVVNFVASNEEVQKYRDNGLTIKTTLGKMMDVVGKEQVQQLLQEKAVTLNYNPSYECTKENVMTYWLNILIFIAVFPTIALITLQFVDNDKENQA